MVPLYLYGIFFLSEEKSADIPITMKKIYFFLLFFFSRLRIFTTDCINTDCILLIVKEFDLKIGVSVFEDDGSFCAFLQVFEILCEDDKVEFFHTFPFSILKMDNSTWNCPCLANDDSDQIFIVNF